MLKFRENEDAVSPVIGVILMVAITVILAAVVAGFVFGMVDSVDTQPKIVAATAQLSGDYVIVTYHGGPDHDKVEEVTCSVVKAGEKSSNNLVTENVTIVKKDDSKEDLKVGYKWSVQVLNDNSSNNCPGEMIVVTVSAKFNDGTEKVILDKNLKLPGTSSSK